MLKDRKTKIIATLGPSTNSEEAIRRLKASGVDFVRINMSHSTTEDLRYFINLAKKVGLPFIVDTEGSQIRTGQLKKAPLFFNSGDIVKLTGKEVLGDSNCICIKPEEIVSQLTEGDIVYCDFDSFVLRVCDTKSAAKGFVEAQVIASGSLGNNKGVVVHSALPGRRYLLPALTPKDRESIRIGLSEGVGYIAASFMRSGDFVDEVRKVTKGKMKIISKIECLDGLERLDEIIEKTDFLLVDRGDLSKEIAIERVPLITKMITKKALRAGKGTFVATNLLESMIEKSKPTRAEVHDIEQVIIDGACGLTLSAETAVGKYPFLCANTLTKTIDCVEGYLKSGERSVEYAPLDSLISPHGGILVDGMIESPDNKKLVSLPKIKVSDEHYMDAEQIALGTFSPLSGFMDKNECESVLNQLRLPSGVIWPLPIVLDVSSEEARSLPNRGEVILADKAGLPFGILDLRQKYQIDKTSFAKRLYKTNNLEHPGVRAVMAMHPVLLAGEVKVFRRRPSPHKCYEISPRQARRLFEDLGWRRIVGFHTRNVPHRGHEFIQLAALEKTMADGLFVHPVIGKKKKGDFHSAPIIKSYEMLTQKFYPPGKVVFGTYATFSRYAGPREALFTALCRKNFGCSHFIVGRDHTGVGDFYHPKASHKIFDQVIDEIGIVPVRFDQVFYSKRERGYIHEGDDRKSHKDAEKLLISGTQARKTLLARRLLPRWFMRPEISKLIVEMIEDGDDVFVE